MYSVAPVFEAVVDRLGVRAFGLVPVAFFSVIIANYCGLIYSNFRVRRSINRVSRSRSGRGILVDKTQLLRCKISHRRLFPRSHAFIYSCLSVGITVRKPTSSWTLSVDESKWWKRGLLHVDARHHLGRFQSHCTLSQCLDEFLKTHGLDPSQFPVVYLFTSARIFTFGFSPASFWYLYTRDLCLRYVLAEVNNTFGEKRVYIFPSSETSADTFRETCAKDFHVSPFNSRKGTYSLTTTDPLRNEDLDVRVTLWSSKNCPKLVARWGLDAPAITPSESTLIPLLRCMIYWAWTVFATFPRIVYQALLLARVRGLHMWYRPEPNTSSIARAATPSERFLGCIFAEYIRYIGHYLPMDMQIMIHSPRDIGSCAVAGGGDVLLDIATLRQPQVSQANLNLVDLRIHTPKFYRHMILSAGLADLLSHTMLSTWEENRMVWSNRPIDLIRLLQDAQKASDNARPFALKVISDPVNAGLLRVVWSLYQLVMKTQPTFGTYPSPGLPMQRKVVPSTTNEGSPLSYHQGTSSCFLQPFLRNHCSAKVQLQYMRASLAIRIRAWVWDTIGGE
ncbi:hypothetical protein F4808DRAFT_446368 [Astrocystis sublimbata]|nr:hypothetical protein F4808DRAFT_446359 [Astrocystis sublimbata]KAI0188246.1 hypothetical protein F4808DRAFT_446368 [Astrocystis sublimbata]